MIIKYYWAKCPGLKSAAECRLGAEPIRQTGRS